MNTRFQAIRARQILDSRGRPTVEAEVTLADGSVGRASVPSGASRGMHEACELRDGGERYGGLGVSRAVANVNGEIARSLAGHDATDQRRIDRDLCELDGTPQLQRLGANAILAVSLASCRAVAAASGQWFYQRIHDLSGLKPTLPLPMVNIFSGGLHAAGGMDFQDFLAIPIGAPTFSEALHWLAGVRDSAADVSRARGMSTLLADEGGLSPGPRSAREVFQLMLEAIEQSGLRPGDDIAIAVDAASTGLLETCGKYTLHLEGKKYTSEQMIEMFARWSREFPIVSLEDGLAEEDWTGWRNLTRGLGKNLQLVGDDLFTTNAGRLSRGIREGVANAILIKANQNGTLTGTLEVLAQARRAGYATIVSARSGETEDAFMSDLAVGTGAGQIKIGSLRTSSTVAKYNQLLRIEESLGPDAQYIGDGVLSAGRSAPITG